MDININEIKTNFKGEKCFVHARGAVDDKDRFFITTQPLRLSGCDVFYGMHHLKSMDKGKTWSDIIPCKNLTRKPFGEDMEYALSDATPMFHKATKTFLATGHSVVYKDDNLAPAPRKVHILYTVYNEAEEEWEGFKELKIPGLDEEDYFAIGSGCAQCVELPDGDILIPVAYKSRENALATWTGIISSAVIRCSFDGNELIFKEMGNGLSVDIPRGLYEPSLIEYNNEFFLSLRNDESGHVTKGKDGLNFEEPVKLCFDDGENAGNYDTQQHWLKGDGKLYMVYTRKDESNGHVYNHRAPLFMSEFDTEKMCLIRDTEVVVVPNRGARLGNFGCFNVSDKEAYVVAAEWMQCGSKGWQECVKYGSDNTIFVTKITF